MALKAVIESLDGVDDALRPLYKEVDKRWVLDVDGVDDHPSVRNLKTAFETHKARNSELTTKVAEQETRLKELPEDFDPEKWIEFKALAADSQRDKVKKDEEVANLTQLHQSRLEQQAQKFTADIEAEKAKNNALEAHIDGIVRDRELTELLVGANVAKGLMQAARLQIGSQVKTERLEGGQRRNVVETNVGPVPLKDWMREWASSDEAEPFLAKATGPDATGSHRKVQGMKMTRAEFEKLSPQGQFEASSKMAKGELTVVDG